jgi:hypothetical protein
MPDHCGGHEKTARRDAGGFSKVRIHEKRMRASKQRIAAIISPTLRLVKCSA